MNNRIFELIQALNGIRGLLWTEEDKEELAQLIVLECLNNMKNCDGDLNFAIWKTKKHFGVEE